MTTVILAAFASAAPVSPGPGSALKPAEVPVTAPTLPPELSRDESLDTGVKVDRTEAPPEASSHDDGQWMATRVVRTQSRVVGLD